MIVVSEFSSSFIGYPYFLLPIYLFSPSLLGAEWSPMYQCCLNITIVLHNLLQLLIEIPTLPNLVAVIFVEFTKFSELVFRGPPSLLVGYVPTLFRHRPILILANFQWFTCCKQS
ncbi:Pectinesterase precursor [Dorcoceras hygrometricum]|uniref:Pectinesterase n=1 Tax=Dorcoceras hygrometricum TaxID=472368 RepID=A0A2Z6ZZJ8_9LAMI|nr:Pectinesterase precursor [Dorcoceras hygrometricum]